MSASTFVPPLFDAEGDLRPEAFEASALQLLETTLQWLVSTERGMFLPIDLLVVLVQQGEPTISRAVARLVRGSDDDEGLGDQLGALARKIDRREEGHPRLNAAYFSLGFSGVLSDAWDWADETGRSKIAYRDIVRVMRWRAEYQESASVRWALRQLIQPGGERLFDSSGLLLEPLFSLELLTSLKDGVQLSARAGLPFLGTPHFIAALCSNRRSLLWRASESAAVDPLRVRDELLRIVGQRMPALPPFALHRRTLTPRIARVLHAAHDRAEAAGRTVEESDVLDAFLEDGGSSLELLRALGVEPRLRERLSHRPAAARRSMPPSPISGGRVMQLAPTKASDSTLKSIGRDLTAEARSNRLTPVLGRDDELQRIVNVLLRTEQRNPLLTGEPGVGKTALASALAQAIVDRRVPSALQDMRVIELNGASLVGGTSFRGELEERLARILKEAEDKVILFMDEAHAVFAPAGAGGRPAEVPNHFKAALASGKIAVVAATTDDEYQRWFELDSALKRRFERIPIDELPAVVTRRILLDLSEDWERRYEVRIPEDAVDAAVELSMRFLPEQSQPDKAKKLLMDSAITLASSHARSSEAERTQRPTLERQHVAEALSLKTGIPLSRILRGRSDWWRGLADRLHAHVPGHRSIAMELTERLLSSRIGQSAFGQNQMSFVFTGGETPAKEQFAHALSEELFGRAQAFMKLDMSDFQDRHSISRLLGSPPGYVGYQDEDALVTPLRRRPAQVVYLANFHLSHPQIQDRLLRMLDDGEITDMRGMRADCRHAVFILAIDTEEASSPIGFSPRENVVSESLSRLSPELARRLSGDALTVVSFGQFDAAEREQTLRNMFESMLEQTTIDFREAYGVTITIPPTLLDELLFFAGPRDDRAKVHQLIQAHVVRPVITAMLAKHSHANGIQIEALPLLDIEPSAVEDIDLSEAFHSDS